MRVALLGAGAIAGLVLDHCKRGVLPDIEVVGIAGRSDGSRGATLGRSYGVPYVLGGAALAALGPEVIVEAASHEAVREHLIPMLETGIGMIVLSAGALVDDRLREGAEAASRHTGAVLHVPSGGIAGLDALKAACAAGVDEVRIKVAKPPIAWRGIPFVQAAGVNLETLSAPFTLFEGTAREGVPHFPQNVNIAAVLSLSGVGFDRTRLQVVADPALTHNTHTIEVAGKSGRMRVILENVPSPDNPKTALLACFSAIAALRSVSSPVRYGT
jgi:aspartate dehydrogenase